MELFKVWGSVLINNDGANASLDKTDKKAGGVTKTLGKGIATAAKWGAGLALAAGAGAAALFGVATKAAESTDRIDKLSQKIGLSRKGFQEWDFIMSQSGASVEDLQSGFKTFTKQIDEASKGTKLSTEYFKDLGVSINDNNGKMKSQEQLFNETVTALQGMEEGPKKAALANNILGKSASELAPLLNGATGSVEEMRKKANELGLVLGDDAVDAGVKFTDSVDQMKRSLGSMVTNIGVSVMPIIQGLLEWVMEHMPEIKAVFKVVFDVIGGLVKKVGGFITNTLIPALTSLYDWIQPHIPEIKETIKTAFELIKKAIDDVIETVSNIIDWFVKYKDIITPIVAAVSIVIINAWVVTTAKAVASAIIHGIQSLKVVANWLLMGIKSTFHALVVVASWVATGVGAVKSALVTAGQAAIVVAKWAWMGVKSTFHALKVVASWVATSAGAIAAGIVMVAQSAVVVAKWVWMGVQSTIQAAKMAAAWIIAMGPIAWVAIAVAGIAALIAANWDTIKAKTIEIFTNVSTWLSTKWTEIKTEIGTKVDQIKQAIWDKWEAIKKDATDQWEFIKKAIYQKWEDIKAFIPKKWEEFKKAIRDKMSEIKADILQKWEDIKTDMKNIDLIQIGKDIINGLIQGVKNKMADLRDAVEEMASSLPGWIKKILGIQSPSTVMQEVGQYTIDGLVVGIGDRTGEVGTAMDGIVSAVSSKASGLIALGTSMGQDFTNSFRNSINYTPPRDDGYTIGPDGTLSGGVGDGSSSHKGSSSPSKSGGTLVDADGDNRIDYKVNEDGSRVHYAYHEGGWVGKAVSGLSGLFGNLKFDEVPAILQAGEFVLSREMIKGLASNSTSKEKADNSKNITQTVNIYSPIALSPSEIARQTKRAMQELALAF